MTDVLQTWLRNRLGVVIDLTPEIFGYHTRDGNLLAHILHTYDIINSDQLKTIIHTEDPALCRVNLNLLRVWLKFIGVDCNNDCITEVSHGKGTTSLQLFYKVYLSLENKDKLHFITLQKEREKFIPTSTKFDIRVVCEDPPPYEPAEHPLAQSLLKHSETIQWHREKLRSIVEAWKLEREKFEAKYPLSKPVGRFVSEEPVEKEKELESKRLDEFSKKLKSEPLKKDDYDPCKRKREFNTAEFDTPIEDTESARTYVEWLKNRSKRAALSYSVRSRIQKQLLTDIWEKLLEKQEEDFDRVIARRMLDQSRYEKQIMTKLCQVRNYKTFVAENRKIVEDLVYKAKEYEFRLQEERERELMVKEFEEEEAESRRLSELKRRIEDEKVRRLREKHRRVCKEIVYDFVDVSIKFAEYRETMEDDVPRMIWSDWKTLFLKSQPIFETVETVNEEDGINEADEEEQEEVVEKVSMERQAALSEADFENYHNFNSPWDEFMPIIDSEVEENLDLGRLVLGYVVHRLLEFVYPYPTDRLETPVAKVKIAAIVLGVLEMSLYETIKILLQNSGVRLVTMEDAINHCLTQYKSEMSGIEDINISVFPMRKVDSRRLEGKKRPLISRSKNLQEKLKVSLGQGKNTVEKETQTPRDVPYEDMHPVLSDTAYIGKWTYEFLTLGQPISNELNTKILIEYLKSLKNEEGWVLMNYPNNYIQMASLESALTGRSISTDSKVIDFKDISIEEIDSAPPRIVFEDEDVDTFALCRQSRLVPNPIEKSQNSNVAQTFMTKYITAKIKPKTTDFDENEMFEVISENSTSMDSFYADGNVAYVFYYTALDLPTLKELTRLILEDKSMPRTPSAELFGEDLQTLKDKKDLSVKLPKSVPIVKKFISRHEWMSRKAEEEQEEQEEVKSHWEITDQESVSIKSRLESSRAAKPGGANWEWVHLPLPSSLLENLASLWENLEETYIESLKSIFLLKRIHSSSIIPYKETAMKDMNEFIERPDKKQESLDNFHRAFNEIDEDMREDVRVKCELHCRVADFQVELWEICDRRRYEAEDQRREIINNNWTYFEAITLINLYIGIIQAEIDRCVDTLKLLQDYYLSMLQKPLQKQTLVQKIFLNRLNKAETKEGINDSSEIQQNSKFESKKGSKTKGTSAKASVRAPPPYPPAPDIDPNSFKKEIDEMLINVEVEFNVNENSVYKVILENVQYVRDFLNSLFVVVNEVLKKEEAAISKSAWKKSKSSSQHTDTTVKKLQTNRVDDLLGEWQTVVMYEMNRMRIRLSLLSSAAEADVCFLLNGMRLAFQGIYKKIVDRYKREISSVNTMANVFCLAIENSIPIRQEMLFDGDVFIVRPNDTMYPKKPQPPPPPITETIIPSQFRMVQLGRLMTIFRQVATEGRIAERNFVYILQDLVSCGEEEGGLQPLPFLWHRLRPCDVTTLICRIFGSVEYIDWREFIIYAMDLPMPSYQQILHARNRFRSLDPELKELVTRQQYNSVPLWFFESNETLPEVRYILHEDFERNYDELYDEETGFINYNKISGLKGDIEKSKLQTDVKLSARDSIKEGDALSQEKMRMMLAKELICQMFLTSYHAINYTALLLAFCKDEDPREGFGKALAVAMGSKVCTDVEEGERYIAGLLRRKKLAEEAKLTREYLRQAALEATQNVLNQVINRAVRDIIIMEEKRRQGDVFGSSRRLVIEKLDEPGLIDPSELLPVEVISEDLVIDDNDSDSIGEDEFETTLTPSVIAISESYHKFESEGTIYWLPREVCLAVLSASLPWHVSQLELFDTTRSLRENVALIYEELKDESLNEENDAILAHRLINHNFMTKLFASTSKFTTKHIGNLLREIQREREREKTEV